MDAMHGRMTCDCTSISSTVNLLHLPQQAPALIAKGTHPRFQLHFTYSWSKQHVMSQPTLKMIWQHSAPAEPPQLFTAHANLRLHSNSCHDTLHVITDSIPAAVQCDDCTLGVMLNFADWAVTVELLVEVLGDVLHQGTQGTVQDQIALTC